MGDLFKQLNPPGNNQLAAMAASQRSWNAFGGGGSNPRGGVAGGVGIGGPVWTSNSGAVSAGVGAFTNFGRGVRANPGIGGSLKFSF